MNNAKNDVRQLDVDEEEFEDFKPVYLNSLDGVTLFDIATTRFAMTQPNGSEKVKMSRITERRSLWSWLSDFAYLALIACQLLSMHTTA